MPDHFLVYLKFSLFYRASSIDWLNIFAICLITLGFICCLITSYFRYELYENFYNQGHRYVMFNLNIEIGLLILLIREINLLKLISSFKKQFLNQNI